jgi:hypothetical protein
MLWTNTSVLVPAFAGATTIDLPVDCTFDFNVAATKYFAGMEEGEAPLLLLFSGTIFIYGGNRRVAGDADSLGEGGALSAARANVARDDGQLLSQQRLAVFAA